MSNLQGSPMHSVFQWLPQRPSEGSELIFGTRLLNLRYIQRWTQELHIENRATSLVDAVDSYLCHGGIVI